MNTIPLEISQYLKTDDDIRVFLQEVADTGTASDFLHAVEVVMRAKCLNPPADNPSFESVFNDLKSCGLSLSIQ